MKSLKSPGEVGIEWDAHRESLCEDRASTCLHGRVDLPGCSNMSQHCALAAQPSWLYVLEVSPSHTKI